MEIIIQEILASKCKYVLEDGVYYMICDGKKIPVDIDASPMFRAKTSAKINLKKVYDAFIEKYTKTINNDFKLIQDVLKPYGESFLYVENPDFTKFKKFYSSGGSVTNIPFYITILHKAPNTNYSYIINKTLQSSKYSEGYTEVKYPMGDSTRTDYTFYFNPEKTRDFNLDELETGVIQQKKHTKPMSEKMALDLAVKELLNFKDIKRVEKEDIEIIAEKYGISPEKVRKVYESKTIDKFLENRANDLYEFLILNEINPNVDEDGYKKHLNGLRQDPKSTYEGIYKIDDAKLKEIDKIFRKKYWKKFDNIDKTKIFVDQAMMLDMRLYSKPHKFKKKDLKKQVLKIIPIDIYMKLDKAGIKGEEGLEEFADFYVEKYLNKHIEQEEKFEKMEEEVVNTTLSRLPRFIYNVVKRTPIIHKKIPGKSKSRTLAYYKPDKGHIVLYLSKLGNLKSLIQTLGHEYWHAFEYKTGFKNKMKDEFNKIVDQIKFGNITKNSMEDFEKVVELVYYYTRNSVFKKTLEEFKKRWTSGRGNQDYFKSSTYIKFINKLDDTVEKRDFYESLSEVLAETLGHIVSGESSKALSQSIVVWMNKKFSSKEKEVLKMGEKIISSVTDEKKIELTVKDPDKKLERLLNCIKDKGNVGHSFSIIVDPEDEEEKHYWDGDGLDYIKDIKVKKAKKIYWDGADRYVDVNEDWLNEVLSNDIKKEDALWIVDEFNKGADTEHSVSKITGIDAWTCKKVLDLAYKYKMLK